MLSTLKVHDFYRHCTSCGLVWLNFVMFTGKKLELSKTIKDDPPAEPSFKVKMFIFCSHHSFTSFCNQS